MVKSDNIKDLFTPSGCLSSRGLTLYIEGGLDAKEKKLAELHIAGCELCADAVSGYREHGRPERIMPHVHDLNRQLHQRFLKIHRKTGKKERSMVSLFSVAATVILLAGIFLLLKQREMMTDKTLAQAVPDSAAGPEEKSTRPAEQPQAEYSSPAVKKPAVMKEKKTDERIPAGTSTQVKEEELLLIEPAEADAEAIMDIAELPESAEALPEILTDSVVIHGSKALKTARAASPATTGTRAEQSAYAKSKAVLTGQDEAGPVEAHETEAFLMVEEMPSFLNGDVNRFLQYIQENIVYPAAAAEAGIEGRVVLSFIIDETGRLTDARIIRSAEPRIDAEALRAVTSSPLWKPGMQGGHPVKVSYTVPVIFSLRGD